MNKEKKVLLKETYDYLKNIDFDKVECQSDIYLDYIMLYEENKQLKEQMQSTYETSQELLSEMQIKIDKAIEYIEHFSCDEVCENLTIVAKILKEILKGE